MFEAGEGRTRFLALWGLMTSIGFLVAIVFSLVGLFVAREDIRCRSGCACGCPRSARLCGRRVAGVRAPLEF